ncbi:endothelin-converting enzyme 1-like [Prorops nasuta]|uniref:endothelin-converting enzyme 1-like n=1 Tax=Prorops nasuta TaxID=863751 RepID=UPI0034CDE806
MREVILLLIVTLAVNDAVNPEDKAFHHEKPGVVKTYEVCRTPKCKQIGKALTESMDRKAQPCENFYQYMCGGWKKKHPIAPGYHTVTTSQDLLASVKYALSDFVKNKSRNANGAFDIAEKYFSQCMDSETIDKQGVKPLMELMDKVGKWPLLYKESAITIPSTWQETFAKAINELLEYSSLFNVGVLTPDNLDNSRMIEISAPKPILLKDDHHLQSDYKKFIMKVANYLRNSVGGSANSDKHMEKDIDDMLKFEIALVKIISSEEDKEEDEDSVDQDKIQNFQKDYDKNGGKDANAKIDWANILNLHFSQAGIQISPKEEIYIDDTKFFKKLPGVLQKTKPVTIVNYIFWRFIYSMKFYADSTLIGIDKDHMKNHYPDTSSMLNRLNKCLDHANLKRVTSYLFIQKRYSQETHREVSKLVNNIKEETKKVVGKVKWMDKEAKQKSLLKLDKMLDLIGYPEREYTAEAVNSYYKTFTLGKGYMHSAFNFLKFERKKSMENLRKRPTRSEWSVEPTYDNDFYQPAANTITLPVVTLQPPFFDADLPFVLNYAGLGTTIGHEISHAFDRESRHYDHNGKEVKDYWSSETVKNFKALVECFITQYDKIPVRELATLVRKARTNGKRTASENIADNFGVHTSYRGYKEEQKKNGGIDVRLDGFTDFNSDKLFFMYYASTECINEDEETMEKNLHSDEHASNEARVIGTLQNSEEFAEVFKCPRKSTMNPKEKCSIIK